MKKEKEKRESQVRIQVPLLEIIFPFLNKETMTHLTSAVRELALAYRAMIRHEATLLTGFLQVRPSSKKEENA